MGSGRTPIANAPPKSLSATHGQGSREWSIVYTVTDYYRLQTLQREVGSERFWFRDGADQDYRISRSSRKLKESEFDKDRVGR